jgi:GNAT superfamily N-acetyltransferase
MINIEKVDTTSKKQVNEFVEFPFQIYEGVEQWVPPILADIKTMLNSQKHPFYEHSDAEFFVARDDDGKMLGRIGFLENKPSNKYHDKKVACFYLFESVDDQSVAEKLFETGYDWAHKRGLNQILGPKGLSSFDGYGFLVEGFEHRQMMTMMNYNLPNYPKFVEAMGFKKVVDWVSSYANIASFELPEKVKRVAERVEEKGKFKVVRFKNKAELKKWAWRIGQAYNKSFVNNWEYYPLTDNEIKFVLDNIMVVAVPDLLKIITYNDEVVGFLLAFPDISAALQKYKGRLSPIALYSYLRELKTTKWLSFNGIGILPELHGMGGNALMFNEIYKSAKSHDFVDSELTQIAETAKEMRKDLENLGVKPYKNHRIYAKDI